MARITVLVIAAISVFLARNPDSSVFRIVSFAWAGFGATFGAVMLFALFWKRSNRQGAIVSMFAGGVMIFVWKYLVRPMGGAWDIYELLPAFLVAMVLNIIVSLMTAPPEKEIVDEFEKAADFQGVDDSGKSYTVRVRKAKCYQQALSELYQVFVYNKICWTTVNTGYLDRFYEVYADGETDINSLKIEFGSYGEDIKNDMLLLWNIEKFTFQCRKFMVPCMDEKYYEHELDLKNYDLDSGYMLGINEDVLKVRHEKDKIIMTSLKESFRDWEVYRFIEKTDTSSHGYTCEMLSNSRKSSFFQNYRERQESSLGSRTELFWMVQSFEHNVYVELEKCEVLETPPESCLEGDMNPFFGKYRFPDGDKKNVGIVFHTKGTEKELLRRYGTFFRVTDTAICL